MLWHWHYTFIEIYNFFFPCERCNVAKVLDKTDQKEKTWEPCATYSVAFTIWSTIGISVKISVASPNTFFPHLLLLFWLGHCLGHLAVASAPWNGSKMCLYYTICPWPDWKWGHCDYVEWAWTTWPSVQTIRILKAFEAWPKRLCVCLSDANMILRKLSSHHSAVTNSTTDTLYSYMVILIAFTVMTFGFKEPYSHILLGTT